MAGTPSTSFYAAAHPDDWQLFETPNSVGDVLDTGDNPVFLYITAGDAGSGTGNPSPIGGVPYFQVREDAAKRSIRFVSTLQSRIAAPATSTVTIRGHSIHKYVAGRSVSYFLRLPDGNANDGMGYPATGMQSLLRLRTGAISTLPAIDNSATYTSWADLVATVTAIVQSEAAGSPDVWINVHDPNSTTNPGSHPDHYQTGMAMQTAIANLPCINQALYVDYAKSSRPENLSSTDSRLQAAVFATVISGVIDTGFDSSYMSESQWLGRNYFRTMSGSGPCSFTA